VAVVSPPSDPDRLVEFFDGALSLGSATLSGGTASLPSIATFSVGSHPITATYTPADTSFATSTSSPALNQVVGAPPHDRRGRAMSTRPSSGQPVTLSATVAVVSPAVGPRPARRVLRRGPQPRQSATLSGGTASLPSIATFSVGSHPITATYTAG